MPDPADGDDLLGVIDGIENAIVPYTHPQGSTSTPDAFSSTRPGIVGESQNAGIDAPEYRVGQCL
jgi:hypothetical protein